MKYFLGAILILGAAIAFYWQAATADTITSVPVRFESAVIYPLNQEVGMDKRLVTEPLPVASDKNHSDQ